MFILKILFFYYFLIIKKSCWCQDIPNSPCPEVFEYESQSNGTTGLLKLSNVQLNNTDLQIQMSEDEESESQNITSIELVDSQEQVTQQIANGQPVHFRIHFQTTNDRIPKVVSIYLNENLICNGQSTTRSGVFGRQTVTVFSSQMDFSSSSWSKPTYSFTNIGPTVLSGPQFFNTNNGLPSLLSSNTMFESSFFSTNTGGQIGNPIIQNQLNSPNLQNFLNNNWQTSGFTNLNGNNQPVQAPAQYIPTQGTTKRPQTEKPRKPVCGKPSTNFRKNLLNQIQRGEYPWLVGIYAYTGKIFQYICSGTIVSENMILTSAHCLTNSNNQNKNITIELGRYNMLDPTEVNNGIKYVYVNDVIINPGYKSTSVEADIGLLITQQEITYTDYIRPICLHSADDNIDNIVDKKATILDWGSNKEGKLTSTRLTHVSIMSKSTCSYQSSKTICAGRLRTDHCQGGSSAGLIMKMNDQWFLRGIVSNAECNSYGIFTDILKYREWLQGYLLDNN
uniref:Putative trypsin-like serine protease n=1 Tax=Corethrella appendiculata TaxID=1370023 RepID=U5ETQ1_9DIPT